MRWRDPGGSERVSVPCFADPDVSGEVRPPPACADSGHSAGVDAIEFATLRPRPVRYELTATYDRHADIR